MVRGKRVQHGGGGKPVASAAVAREGANCRVESNQVAKLQSQLRAVEACIETAEPGSELHSYQTAAQVALTKLLDEARSAAKLAKPTAQRRAELESQKAVTSEKLEANKGKAQGLREQLATLEGFVTSQSARIARLDEELRACAVLEAAALANSLDAKILPGTDVAQLEGLLASVQLRLQEARAAAAVDTPLPAPSVGAVGTAPFGAVISGPPPCRTRPQMRHPGLSVAHLAMPEDLPANRRGARSCSPNKAMSSAAQRRMLFGA